MFSRVFTPRNESFYRSDSPCPTSYRPQTADQFIFRRTRSARMIESKGGRETCFILIGRASHPNTEYDCKGVAASRVLDNESNKGDLPAPGQYHAHSEHVVSKAQIKKYLNTQSPNTRRSKDVNHRKYVPYTKHKRITVPRFVSGNKESSFAYIVPPF